jgi:E3 ubiquitin-protein ligase listerin
LVKPWIDSRAKAESTKSLEELLDTLSDSTLWTGLYHAQLCPFAPDSEVIGHGQPLVRSATWSLLDTLLRGWKGE